MAQKILIAGAGQAGFQTAFSLRQSGFDGEVKILAGEPHPPYQRPPLSKQVLKGEWPSEKCFLRQADFYPEHQIEIIHGIRATALDAESRQVAIADGSVLDYDRAVICTGSRLNRLHIPGADLPGVHYLRTIDHTLQLLPLLTGGARLVIAGAGYIGLEVAASARALGCEVTVVEALERVMQRSALEPVAEFFKRRHETEGVSFHFGRRLEAIEGSGKVEGVLLDDGTRLPAELVLKAVGVRPDIDWLDGSGVETGRGIRVDSHCQTNLPGVYAAGDVTELQHPLFAGRMVLESVQNAIGQGKTVAANILGAEQPYAEVPWFWSDQYDCKFQMAGLQQAGDQLVIRESGPNSISVLSVGDGKLNAVQCVNSMRDYMAGRKLIALGGGIDAGRLLQPELDLKELF